MRRLPLLLVAALALTGCLEAERTVTLEPDGRGTLRLVHTLGKEVSAELGPLARDEAKLRQLAVGQLKAVQGVAAWTDVSATVTEDGRVRVEATGWFEDVGALAQTRAGRDPEPFVVVRREGTTWRVSLPPIPDEGQEPPAGVDVGQMVEGLRRAVTGLRIETRVVVPGEVVQAGEWRQEGRTLVNVVDEAMIAKATAELPEGPAGARELNRRLCELVRAEATVEVSAAAPTEGFSQRFRAAVAAWEASPWRAALSDAQDEAAREESGEPRPAAAPDRFEPNDEREQARPLEAGRHPGLVAERDGDDWYAVTVPAGHELSVTAEVEGDDSLQLVLHEGPGYRPLASDFGLMRAARVRLVAGDAERRLHLGVLLGDETPYALRIELKPYTPGDAFEPNDTASQAAKLPLGEHDGLVIDSEDWYLVDVPAGRALEVRVRWKGPRGRVMVTAVGPDERDMGGVGAGRLSPEQVLQVVAPPGGVRLRARGEEGVRYALALSTAEAPADLLEPNDTPAEARPLAPGTHEALLDGADWYRVELAPGKRLRVRARRADQGNGRLELAVHRPDAPEAAEDAAVGLLGPAELIVARRTPGPLLLHVSGGGQFAYRLELVEEPFVAEDPHEPNDVPADAVPLEPGTHRLICGREGGDDWYTVQVPAGARLKLVVAARLELVVQLEVSEQGGDRLADCVAGGQDDSGAPAGPSECRVEPAPVDRTLWLRLHRAFSMGRDQSLSLTVDVE